MRFIADKLFERTVLDRLSKHEKGVCEVVAAVMSFSHDAHYRVRHIEAETAVYKTDLDQLVKELPGWLYIHNNAFVDDAVGVYDPLWAMIRDAKRIFESVKKQFSAMPPTLLQSDICSFIQECISLCDSLTKIVEQYKSEEESISKDGKRCLELKRTCDNLIMAQGSYHFGYAKDLLLIGSPMSEDECVRKLDDVDLMLKGTHAYELTKDIDDDDEEAVASMLYHKTLKEDYTKYYVFKYVLKKLKSILQDIKKSLEKKRIEGWVVNRRDIDILRKVLNQAQMHKGKLSASQCAFVVFREFVERGYTVNGKDGWKTLSCSAFVLDMNKGVDKDSDNHISENAFSSFRRMCKNGGSLYELPEGKDEKYRSQLKVVMDGSSTDVDNVIDAVKKAFASSKTAIA